MASFAVMTYDDIPRTLTIEVHADELEALIEAGLVKIRAVIDSERPPAWDVRYSNSRDAIMAFLLARRQPVVEAERETTRIGGRVTGLPVVDSPQA